ncbi:uncharacterized protein LOC109819408 [Asparagus officinalis]|uniref:uncharacterized protein LOC109819408 n=1 Tax=Asparagus officinalis TaxID=4686 RepID=UPI00098DEE0A|nr:uncharacterized protein LOC109819408 [Asparagus officinalis]
MPCIQQVRQRHQRHRGLFAAIAIPDGKWHIVTNGLRYATSESLDKMTLFGDRSIDLPIAHSFPSDGHATEHLAQNTGSDERSAALFDAVRTFGTTSKHWQIHAAFGISARNHVSEDSHLGTIGSEGEEVESADNVGPFDIERVGEVAYPTCIPTRPGWSGILFQHVLSVRNIGDSGDDDDKEPEDSHVIQSRTPAAPARNVERPPPRQQQQGPQRQQHSQRQPFPQNHPYQRPGVQTRGQPSVRCSYCSYPGHTLQDCPRRLHLCFSCGSPDHISRDCPQKQQARLPTPPVRTTLLAPPRPAPAAQPQHRSYPRAGPLPPQQQRYQEAHRQQPQRQTFMMSAVEAEANDRVITDLGNEQVQFDDAAEPVYAQPECPSDGVEEQTEA